MFFKKKQAAFIHIPKTGGTYISQSESDSDYVIQPMKYLGHCCVSEAKQDETNFPPSVGYKNKNIYSHEYIKKYFVFSVVRNIFSWLVSYAGHAAGWNKKYLNINHYDYKNANKGFDYLIQTIANREDVWPCRKFIFFPLFSYEGDLVVDWITHSETLDEDLMELSQRRGYDYIKKNRQRVGNIKKIDYRTYYSDKLINLVNDVWGRELSLFGYHFDGLDISRAIIKNEVSKENKKIKYFWKTDEIKYS